MLQGIVLTLAISGSMSESIPELLAWSTGLAPTWLLDPAKTISKMHMPTQEKTLTNEAELCIVREIFLARNLDEDWRGEFLKNFFDFNSIDCGNGQNFKSYLYREQTWGEIAEWCGVVWNGKSWLLIPIGVIDENPSIKLKKAAIFTSRVGLSLALISSTNSSFEQPQ